MPRRRTLKDAYWDAVKSAIKRDIPWCLSFEEWLAIWEASGHLAERGQASDQYCMARFGDTGPYEVGNVQIITSGENVSSALLGRPKSDAHREALSCALTGRRLSPEQVANSAEGHRGLTYEKHVEHRANYGQPLSEAHREALREAWIRRRRT